MTWIKIYSQKMLMTGAVLLISLVSAAQSDVLKAASDAYAMGDFNTAKDHYSRLIADDQLSASLYYNLGNCHFKLDELGEAIWAYEKALKIDPGHENARFNLEFAQKQTYDQLAPASSDVLRWLRSNFFVWGINFWAYFSVICSVLFSLVLYLFFTTNQSRLKNLALTAGFLFLGLFIAGHVIALLQRNYVIDRSSAIIISNKVTVRTSPSDTANEAFPLHEGTKVNLERSNDQWVEISINGNMGWVEKKEILEI
jgi:tetratricopeptide (TPR) repeat protein